MDNATDKLDQIYKQLEEDRQRALAELSKIQEDATVVEPRYRHKVREVGGQLLKLAIDASMGMAKILEPMTKNQSAGGIGVSKKELLEALEALDGKSSLSDVPVTDADVQESVEEILEIEKEAENELPTNLKDIIADEDLIDASEAFNVLQR